MLGDSGQWIGGIDKPGARNTKGHQNKEGQFGDLGFCSGFRVSSKVMLESSKVASYSQEVSLCLVLNGSGLSPVY